MTKRRIVITGIGVVSSIGLGRKKFWRNLLDGVSGIRPISIFKPFDKYHNLAGEITDLDFTEYLGNKGLKHLDRSTKFLLIAAKLALEDINFKFDKVNNPDIGVIIGTDWGHLESNFHFHNLVLMKGPKAVNPMDFPVTLANSPASQVSIRYGLAGLNTTIARGFTSGIDAIGYATNMVKNYNTKMVLAGGVENLSIELYTIFYIQRWLLGLRKGMKASCKTFNKKRNGIVLGEGACVLILEDMKSAHKRNVDLLAEVAGYGFSFGNDKATMRKSIYLALDDAKLKPNDIDYICANANGSIKDRKELRAIAEIFGNCDRPLISSIKSMIGECFGTTGAMQVASTCLSLSKGLIPTGNTPIKKKIDIAMVNSFGLDGNNACLILKRVS